MPHVTLYTVATVLLLICAATSGTEYKFSIPLTLDLKEEGGIREFTFEIKLGQAPEEALQVSIISPNGECNGIDGPRLHEVSGTPMVWVLSVSVMRRNFVRRRSTRRWCIALQVVQIYTS